MNNSKLAISENSVSVVDIDSLTARLEQLNGTRGMTINNIGDWDSNGNIEYNQHRRIHRPSWSGKIKLMTKHEDDEVSEPFRCGR